MIVAELLGVIFEEESVEVLDHTKKIDELVLYQGLAKNLPREHAAMRMEVSEIFSTPGGICIFASMTVRDEVLARCEVKEVAVHRMRPQMLVSDKLIRFNGAAVSALGGAAFVRVRADVIYRKILVEACDGADAHAIAFYHGQRGHDVRIGKKAVRREIERLLGYDGGASLRVYGRRAEGYAAVEFDLDRVAVLSKKGREEDGGV